MAKTIRNPIEWLGDELQDLARGLGLAGRSVQHTSTHLFTPPIEIQRIGVSDLKEALAKGFDDFGAYRTDLLFLILVYPIACVVIATVAFKQELIPLLFPLVSGSAILGPFVGVFLYELSRRREINFERHHEDVHSWSNAKSLLKSRNFGAIMGLGLILVVLYMLWMWVAWVIYASIQGPQPAQSVGAFIQDLFSTEAGWLLIIVGCGVGFVFAFFALMIGAVSFPLLLDREVGLGTAVGTSVRAVLTNPFTMAVWGLIVVAGLVFGAVPLLLGLVIVMPVLCHGTWHLYRKLIPRQHAARHAHRNNHAQAAAAAKAQSVAKATPESPEVAGLSDEQGMNVVLLLVVIAVGSVLFHVMSPWYWTPIASNWEYIDHTITITFWITGVVFTAIVLFVAYCVYKFHHKPGRRAHYEPESKRLETWLTVITGIGVAAMLAPGLVVWNQFITVPDDASEFEVVGQQWQWSYRFPGEDGKLGTFDTRNITPENPLGLNHNDPNGQDDVIVQFEDLHVPMGKPIKVLLRSVDVLHDFYVPEFRAKMDMIPGMVTYFWFTPTREGTFDILCAELCGTGHGYMRGKVTVVPEAEFQAWLGQKQTFAELTRPAEEHAAK